MTPTTAQAPPAVGSFCWFELNTRDVEGVKKFYKNLCGWTTSPSEMSGGVYHHWHDKHGVMFGGIMDITSPEWGEAPSHWMSYIRTDNVDTRSEKAKSLGATICVPPTDIPQVGRFCVLNDPTGGTFSLIALDDQKPIAPVIVWNELMTRDAAKARDFYTKLLGWKTEDMPMGEEGNYIICKNADVGQGGIFQMDGPKFKDVPPHWLNYIGTDDVDRDAAQVSKLGGTIVVPATDIPNNIGRFCVITDPGGGHIALYQSYHG